MKRFRAFATVGISALIAAFAALPGVRAAENIYPEPGFEQSGTTLEARTGDKAGHLKVGDQNHWAAIGGRMAVEPFARYSVTEWVKADIGAGTFYAPYCYEWDNYEWQFISSHAIGDLDDWTKTQVTFVSPHETMYVHPLAYIDCSNSEAFVDDVVVEKIAEPEQVIEELKRKEKLSGDEKQILARWYVGQGNRKAAEDLMRSAEGLVRTDIACLIAQNTPDAAERRPFVVEMVAYGGPTYHGGMQRFAEITQGMSETGKLRIAGEAVEANAESGRAAEAYRRIVSEYTDFDGELMTVAEGRRHLTMLRTAAKELLQAVPDDSPAEKELRTVMADLENSAEELKARESQLGTCTVRIGGEAITGATHGILIPNEPTPQEEHAAKDLRYHLELITGHRLPIWYEADADDRTPILVGKCDRIGELGADIDFDSLGKEGIHIRTSGPAVILAGNNRGVLYATYTFLEDYLGCRWFAPDCTKWPTEGEIDVPEIDERYIPPLEYRATDYPSSRPADFAVRNKYNGHQHRLDEEHGGRIEYRGFVHTFNALVPPGKYFSEHPEYYSEINGERIGPERTQLCLTNPEVLRIATETVRRWIRESPEADIISVSQNDWHNYCQCDKCSALAEREGSQAGPLLHFVNAIGENIAEDYPEVAIDTLAYTYTRKPPKHVKPRPNVIVRLCSIECCFIHPLATDPYNASFAEDIRGWNEICDRLYIWDYVINYAHSIMPFPNLYVLKPNIKFFVDHGVKGIYEEACYFTKGSEMQELRSYVMAKLLWDPDYDTDKAIDEFCAAYWGPAGKYIREYINVVHESAQSKPDMHVRIYSPPSVGYLTDEVIAKSRELFDKAEAAVADDEELLHRVQVARLPIMYTQIALATSPTFRQEEGKLVASENANIAELAERFERIARAEGVTRVREGGAHRTLDAWLESLPTESAEMELRKIENAALRLWVVPEVGGRIWRMQTVADGHDLLKRHGEEGAWEARRGGYELYSEGGYHTPGWEEAYEVTSASDRAMELRADLRNGLRVVRRIELGGQEPVVNIHTTIENMADTSRRAAPRPHPEFAVSSLAAAEVRTLQEAGQWAVIDVGDPQNPKGEDSVWLNPDDIPGGAWALVDKGRNIAVVNRFEKDKMGRFLLNWNGAESRTNLELFTRGQELAPGESMTLEHSYEVVSADAL